MTMTIAAALIAGGSTAIVAIATSLIANRSNRRIIDAATATSVRALDAAHDEQLWDKQAAALRGRHNRNPAPAEDPRNPDAVPPLRRPTGPGAAASGPSSSTIPAAR